MLVKFINDKNEERWIDPDAVQLVYRDGDVTVIVLDGIEVVTREGLGTVVQKIDDEVGR